MRGGSIELFWVQDGLLGPFDISCSHGMPNGPRGPSWTQNGSLILRLVFEGRLYNMVNATKGLFISCDVPMAQYIINLNNSFPASEKFIIHVIDNTHLFVQHHVADMIRSQIAKFREDNTYVKPT
ncbi:hypothetical protein L6164_037697 [Bauhinia variegata]|uniref:Uncharacterized protein n=1 Tax=Bauhinia variegata TaxID=167791 RepID=A0ACB9KKY5_BAUVA|nr:hypothetical protein L6164_037697 [Bauhinia variegata]